MKVEQLHQKVVARIFEAWHNIQVSSDEKRKKENNHDHYQYSETISMGQGSRRLG